MGTRRTVRRRIRRLSPRAIWLGAAFVSVVALVVIAVSTLVSSHGVVAQYDLPYSQLFTKEQYEQLSSDLRLQDGVTLMMKHYSCTVDYQGTVQQCEVTFDRVAEGRRNQEYALQYRPERVSLRRRGYNDQVPPNGEYRYYDGSEQPSLLGAPPRDAFLSFQYVPVSLIAQKFPISRYDHYQISFDYETNLQQLGQTMARIPPSTPAFWVSKKGYVSEVQPDFSPVGDYYRLNLYTVIQQPVEGSRKTTMEQNLRSVILMEI